MAFHRPDDERGLFERYYYYYYRRRRRRRRRHYYYYYKTFGTMGSPGGSARVCISCEGPK
jgi:hypothetical protein